MKRGIFYLVFGIPAAAVLMGLVTLYIAFSNSDPGVSLDQPAMSKTSWQNRGSP